MMLVVYEDYANAKSSTAWMISRGCSIVGVKMHPLGASDEDALDDANWLYRNSTNEYIRDLCARYIYSYYNNEYGEDAREVFEEDIGYNGYSKEMVDVVNSMFYNNSDVEDSNKLSEEVKLCLNNGYIRCRYGGEYDTSRGSKDLYFRISSIDGFNWYDVIMSAIISIGSYKKIDTVTVETDVNTTGRKVLYWNHLPIYDVLNSRDKVMENLSYRRSII